MSTPSDRSDENTVVIQGDAHAEELKKARESEACLLIVRGNPQGHQYPLSKPETVLGRDPKVDISIISDGGMSKQHCKVVRLPQGGFQVIDLGSTNGTFLNDKRLEPKVAVDLTKEDMLKVGQTIFKYLPAGSSETFYMGNLASQANHDKLTGLFNRGFLIQAVDTEFRRAKALHQNFGIIFFDLDNFKHVNDKFGHDAGDFVLKEIAALTRVVFSGTHQIVARYGGEEFVALLSDLSAEDCRMKAEELRASIQDHEFMYQNNRLPVTSSVGLAMLKPEHSDASVLLDAADKAQYVSKNSGKNRVTAT